MNDFFCDLDNIPLTITILDSSQFEIIPNIAERPGIFVLWSNSIKTQTHTHTMEEEWGQSCSQLLFLSRH